MTADSQRRRDGVFLFLENASFAQQVRRREKRKQPERKIVSGEMSASASRGQRPGQLLETALQPENGLLITEVISEPKKLFDSL